MENKLGRDIDTLANIDSDIAKVVREKNQLAQQLVEGMKKDFDKHIPFEESLMKIIREHGQAVAMTAGSLWIHWFVTERAPVSLGRVDG